MDRAGFEPAHSEMGSTAELPILMAVSPTCHPLCNLIPGSGVRYVCSHANGYRDSR